MSSPKTDPLSGEKLKALIDSIKLKRHKFSAKGEAISRALNKLVSTYNKSRLKTVPKGLVNKAKSGEKHQPIILPNGAMTVAKFSGPSTQFIRRIKEELKKAGSVEKIRGVTPVDTVAIRHDAQYALAGNEPDPKKRVAMIRAADVEMVKRIKDIVKRGLDNKKNTTGGLVIAAKVGLEAVGKLDPGKFAPPEPLGDKERQLAEGVAAAMALSKVGFGKKKKEKKKEKKPRKPHVPSAWNLHVKRTKDLNPGMSLRDAMQAASVTYKKK